MRAAIWKLGGGHERTRAEFRALLGQGCRGVSALRGGAGARRRGAARHGPQDAAQCRRRHPRAARRRRAGRKLAGMPIEAQRDTMDLFVKSARDFLDGWFENAYVKAAFGFDAVVGNYASPDTPGSAYVLLHHVFGEVNGKKGAWGHSIGGMGAITRLMADGLYRGRRRDQPGSPGRAAARRRGPGRGRAPGKRRGDRRRVVAANIGPALLYRQLVDAATCPPTSPGAWIATRPARAPSG